MLASAIVRIPSNSDARHAQQEHAHQGLSVGSRRDERNGRGDRGKRIRPIVSTPFDFRRWPEALPPRRSPRPFRQDRRRISLRRDARPRIIRLENALSRILDVARASSGARGFSLRPAIASNTTRCSCCPARMRSRGWISDRLRFRLTPIGNLAEARQVSPRKSGCRSHRRWRDGTRYPLRHRAGPRALGDDVIELAERIARCAGGCRHHGRAPPTPRPRPRSAIRKMKQR